MVLVKGEVIQKWIVYSFSELSPSTSDPHTKEWVLTDIADNTQLGTTERIEMNERLVEEKFVQEIQQTVAENGKINRKLANFTFVGPTGSGKSSLMARLLRRARKELSLSTGVCEPVVIVDVNFHSARAVDSDTWEEVDYDLSLLRQMNQEGLVTSSPSPLLPKPSEDVEVPTPSPEHGRTHPNQSTPLFNTRVNDTILSAVKRHGGPKSFLTYLKKGVSLYLRDTGGQVEFQEMIALLIIGPSIFLFVFRIDCDFKGKFFVEYRTGKNESINRYTSSITTEEAFLQCLSSVYAMGTQGNTDVKTYKPLVLVIGTHKDNLGSSAEAKIAELNEHLDSLITRNGFLDLVQYADSSKGQVMFAVDNTSESDDDFKAIRSQVNSLISGRDEFTIEYPTTYLLFCLELQNLKRSVLSFEECKDMAANYGIVGDQVSHLLQFLYLRLGVIHYYDVDGLRHIVVKEPQVLFNKFTDLIIWTFSSKALTTKEQSDFQKGILTASILKSVIGSADRLTCQDFLKLLVHLRIITPYPSTIEGEEEERYFIPCVLSHVQNPEEEELRTDILPLSVQFLCSHCPKGLFGVLITHLMTPESEDRPDGHIFFGLKEGKIYKDQVTFKVCCYADEDELCLRMLPTHLEVKFFPSLCEDRDQCIGEVCNCIRQVVETSILRSLHDLHYNKDKVLPITCFRCSRCSELHKVKEGKYQCKIYCEKFNTNSRLPNQARCWYNEWSEDNPEDSSEESGDDTKDPEDSSKGSEGSVKGSEGDSEGSENGSEGSGDQDEAEEKFMDELLQAISEGKKISRKLANSMLIGHPGSGKSSLMYRLLKKRRDPISLSTGVCDPVVIVDIDVDNLSTFHSVTVTDSNTWEEVEYDLSLVRQMNRDSYVFSQPKNSELELSEKVIPPATEVTSRFAGMITPLGSTIVPTPPAASSIQKPPEYQPANKIAVQVVPAAYQVVPPSASARKVSERKYKKVILKTIAKHGGFKEFASILTKTASLYLRDTGGQVEFQEVIALLISGPSIFLFVFRMDHDFNAKVSVEYRASKSESTNRYTSSITTEEALLQCLSSVSAMGTLSSTDVETFKPRVLIIGTHKDQLGPSAEEKIYQLNKHLHSVILKSGFADLVLYSDSSNSQVMFAVDNTSESEEDFERIRSKVNKVISREEFTVEYPIAYLLFCLELQNLKCSIVSLDDCKHIAAEYRIQGEEVFKLLKFLIRIGVIQYYDVNGLRHIVVIDPQILFTKVTNLIVRTFYSESMTIKQLHDIGKGIVTASVLKCVFGDEGKISYSDFQKLLVHLRIITPYPSSAMDNKEERFFIPCVLNHVQASDVEELHTNILPLAVQFKCSHTPKGLFGVLVTHLMTPEAEDRPDGHVSFELDECKIHKDQVSFGVCCCTDEDEVCLKMLPTHLEVKFFPSLSEDRDQSVGKVCSSVCQVIETSILRSLDDLHYNKDKVSPVMCFKCEHCSELHQVKKGKKYCKVYCKQNHKNSRLPKQARWWYNEGGDCNIVTFRLSLKCNDFSPSQHVKMPNPTP